MLESRLCNLLEPSVATKKFKLNLKTWPNLFFHGNLEPEYSISKKLWPVLNSKLLYKMGQDFLDRQ